jgi:hypothetical protein
MSATRSDGKMPEKLVPTVESINLPPGFKIEKKSLI